MSAFTDKKIEKLLLLFPSEKDEENFLFGAGDISLEIVPQKKKPKLILFLDYLFIGLFSNNYTEQKKSEKQ